MAFMDFLLGRGGEEKTKPIYSPQQENLLNQILGGMQQQLPQGLSNIQKILGDDPRFFSEFERPARRAFEQETLPTIAERFTGQFGEGAQRSSAFGQALGTAGRELEENLMARRLGMQTDALSQLLQLLGPSLAPRQAQYTTPRQPGFLESFGAGISPGIGASLPALLGLL